MPLSSSCLSAPGVASNLPISAACKTSTCDGLGLQADKTLPSFKVKGQGTLPVESFEPNAWGLY